jgi:assimilatory nitrate reductase catalytic subunit
LEQAPYPWVEIHEQTAAKLGIADGDWVLTRTRRGEMTVPALVVRSIRPDTIFIPYHYGHNQAVNILTNPVLEPMMKIPEYKVCAAAIQKTETPPDWAVGMDRKALWQLKKERRRLPTVSGRQGPGMR